MITELITGGFGAGVHEKITEELLRLCERGEKCTLIVPEQHALSAEREMALLLPPSAPLSFSVSNFTRFANECFRTLGGVAAEPADRARRALVMWECLEELSPSLSVMGGEVNAGLANRALTALRELESYGIKPESLGLAEEKLRKRNPRLADKLSDLSKISALYYPAMEKKYSERGNELELLIEKLAESPEFLRGESIYFEGFTSFTESQYKLIAALMERANVKIALTLSKHSADSFEFTETRAVKSRLLSIANKAGVTLKETKLDGRRGAALISEVLGLLWKSFGELCLDTISELKAEPERSALKLYEAKNPYEECRFIAADIKGRVMAGEKYSDFAIIARSAESYIGILDAELMRAGIPHFLSKTREIMSFEAVKLIFSALEAACGKASREDVISFLKCGFSGISREACDEFELYTETWQLSGESILDGKPWRMSPMGYSGRRTEKSEQLLASVNETKKRLFEILIPFRKKCDTAKTVGEYATALTGFLLENSTEEKTVNRSRELAALGEESSSEENAALWQLICSALDTLVEAAGNINCDSEGFRGRLELVLSESKIGRIPSFSDTVTVGSADSLRMPPKKHIYLIGLNRGEFPSAPSDRAYFSDNEKKELSHHEIAIESNTEFDYARELFYFSRALSAAEEDAKLFYSGLDFSFKKQAPSEAVSKILKITKGALKPVSISELPPESLLYTPSDALRFAKGDGNPKIIAALKELGYESELNFVNQSLQNSEQFLSKETAELMYHGDMYLSQTRIDKFIDCPLSYFCEYKLKLSDTEKAEFDARGIGSFIHSILENFFAAVRVEGREANKLTEAERAEIAERAAVIYLTELENETSTSARTRFAISRLKSMALPVIDDLCDELSKCLFVPSFFELEIADGKEGHPAAVKFPLNDGTSVKIRGSIDRVDSYKSGDDVYVRVIDYKTGAKSFSPSDLSDGRNLQMFIYLKSIVDTDDEKFLAKVGVSGDGRIIPAGVMYIKTNIKDVKISHGDEALAIATVKGNQKREGMMLSDSAVFAAINPDFSPISFKKDGSLSSKSEALVYTESGWDELSEKVKNAVVKVAESMKSGNISALPLKAKNSSPCTYCQYKAVCRNADVN